MGAGIDGYRLLPTGVDTENGWILPPVMDPIGKPKDWMDSFDRQCLMIGVEGYLEMIRDLTEDKEILANTYYAEHCLRQYRTVTERVITRLEGSGKWADFRRLHRQLTGLATEIAALAGRQPEAPCSAFKAACINPVLAKLRELMGPDTEVLLPSVSETGEHTCSDVSLVLRSWLDLCADYAFHHYDGNPPDIPPVTTSCVPGFLQNMILAFCMDEPRSILEIGEMLGYRDKKTIRKYLNPLPDRGCLARTVPDKPNSRNQRYITASFI